MRWMRREAAALREFRNEQGELTDGAALDANGTALVLSLTEDGAVLSFSLDETHPAVEQNFTFQVPNGVSAPFCISVKDSISAASGEKPNLVLSAQAQDMEVTAEYKGWQASITGPQAELQPTEDGVLPDFAFQLSAISENTAAAGALYTQSQSVSLSLELPQGHQPARGQACSENNVIRIGGTPIATLAGLAQNTEVTAAVQGNACTSPFGVRRRRGKVQSWKTSAALRLPLQARRLPWRPALRARPSHWAARWKTRPPRARPRPRSSLALPAHRCLPPGRAAWAPAGRRKHLLQ